MDNLPFQNEELDLIWSEGAIYNIGFERGMNEWNRFLKKDGFIAVTEASWFTPERPAEIEDFWLANYPEIDTIPTKIAQMEKAGYTLTAHFILPEMPQPQTSLPGNGMSRVCMTSIKNIMVMYSI